ncbi:MAG: TetR/AcrR family transcriptional regulator [Candidatus Cloacimonetes bacterium]|nr:TetR/AcrR family transcriptional regulator [Candidatus Cloacimonadota bacterium]
MNKRQQQKLATRQKLVNTARKLFIKQGFLETTTVQIAKQSGVAHGTLFVHFPTRDYLMIEVLDAEMELLSDELNQVASRTGDFFELLDRYLDFLIEHEDIFAVLARELPFYPDELRRKALFRQAGIQGHFHRALSDAVVTDRFPACNAGMVVQTVFAQLHYYLSLRSVFVDEGSVIERFRRRIVSIARSLVTFSGEKS